MLAPVLGPLANAAGFQPGERVLDVGCGRGATTLLAAAAVGPTGHVTGVDVAERLITAAAALAVPADAAPIEWLVADAQRADFAPASFDVVISRFWVMFFDDPVAAFANLAAAARPGGRLAMATWRPRDASPFQYAGYNAIVTAFADHGWVVPPTDPTAGPYALGLDERIVGVLGAAGWDAIEVRQLDQVLYFAGPGTSVDDAVDLALAMPSMQAVLATFPHEAHGLARTALVEEYEARYDGVGVALPAAMAVTTARR
jgi:SAM-dependent methyltransferase